jgi:Cu(I)/Ag(I) efflux system periplasmic protein CusF
MMKLSKLALAAALGFLIGLPVAAQQNHGHGHNSGSRVSTQPKSEAISGTGVIHAIDAEKRSVNLSHEPIPAIGWPAMTMDMQVAEDVDLDALEVGDSVTFTLARGADGIYMIEEINAVD